MKIPCLLLFCLCLTASRVFAAPEPALSFPSRAIDLPPLSLAELAKGAGGPSVLSSGAAATNRWQEPETRTERRPVSQMPILVPSADIDPKMVKTPDPTVDYKMIVKPVPPAPAK